MWPVRSKARLAGKSPDRAVAYRHARQHVTLDRPQKRRPRTHMPGIWIGRSLLAPVAKITAS